MAAARKNAQHSNRFPTMLGVLCVWAASVCFALAYRCAARVGQRRL